MRSGVQPVAILCNENSKRVRFAPSVDARVLFEDASDASNVLREPILCRKMNVVELAFYEVATWQRHLLPRACYHAGVVEPGPGEHPDRMGREREGKHA